MPIISQLPTSNTFTNLTYIVVVEDQEAKRVNYNSLVTHLKTVDLQGPSGPMGPFGPEGPSGPSGPVGNSLSLAPVPSASTSPGNIGDISYDSNFMYICVGPNNWKKFALTAF